MRRVVWSILIGLALLVMAACGDAETPPDSDPPILGDFESMPKQIATVALTPTPTAVVAGGDTINIAQPTPTSGRSQPTPSLTPYVGIFLGDTAGEDGEPVPTLAPYVLNPFGTSGIVSNSGPVIAPGACSTPVASPLADVYNANANLQQSLGCPLNGGSSLQLVWQPFERGLMIWRATQQIYALADNGQFWQIADSWNEGMPADDPTLSPPGGLLQPVRGFGLAWRSNQPVRDALGWGTQSEAPYSGFWQDFEGGAMFVAANGRIYAIYPAQGQHSGPL